MTPEILAKIMGIVAKGGERVIVVDPTLGVPITLMKLDEYEKLVDANSGGREKVPAGPQLTAPASPGMIDPDVALWAEAAKGAGEWGGDAAEEEEDRYYMEPTE